MARQIAINAVTRKQDGSESDLVRDFERLGPRKTRRFWRSLTGMSDDELVGFAKPLPWRAGPEGRWNLLRVEDFFLAPLLVVGQLRATRGFLGEYEGVFKVVRVVPASQARELLAAAPIEID